MADVTPLDVVKQILARLDVKDLIRYKSVCKPWQSLISSPRFVKSHLNHTYNNDRNNRQLGHRWICMGESVDHAMDSRRDQRSLRVAGSCNGLVCVIPEFEFNEPCEFDEPNQVYELAPPKVYELAIINPLTREVKILPMPRPYPPEVPYVGFGYDSSTDDYKIIVGFTNMHGQKRTLFHVFTLKSNTWNVIGEIKYGCTYGTDGAFCGGALHWFMECDEEHKVIISLDLTTLEFKETPKPECDVDDERKLGVIDECLFIYPSLFSRMPGSKWVMKENKWELYTYDDHGETEYDILHFVEESEKTTNVFSVSDGKKVPGGYLIFANTFVKSLVSPHNNYEGQMRNNNDEERQDTNFEGSKVMRVLKAVSRAT